MAITTATKLDKVEVGISNGVVGVRLIKAIVDDAGNILSSEYHRFSIDPGADFNSGTVNSSGQPVDIIGQVNVHLSNMGFPPVSVADTTKIASYLPH